MSWKSAIDRSMPFWQDYLPLLDRLDGTCFPSCRDLESLLPRGLATVSGHPVRFRPASDVPGTPYEQHIHATGEVCTRKDDWHDLCNALVWARMPATKAAMNALHCTQPPRRPAGTRGRLRDALTLFDECGVVVASSQPRLLSRLADRDWPAAFGTWREAWVNSAAVVVTGHAMLVKFLVPYKAMTANALLIQVAQGFHALPRELRLRSLDASMAQQLLAGGILGGPDCLSPLPLAGIPGWWPDGVQDQNFYRDPRVFRPPREGRAPAPVFRIT